VCVSVSVFVRVCLCVCVCEKPQFKVALKIFYVHTPFTLWMKFLHVQMICITDLHDCQFLHCNNFICLVCF